MSPELRPIIMQTSSTMRKKRKEEKNCSCATKSEAAQKQQEELRIGNGNFAQKGQNEAGKEAEEDDDELGRQ